MALFVSLRSRPQTGVVYRFPGGMGRRQDERGRDGVLRGEAYRSPVVLRPGGDHGDASCRLRHGKDDAISRAHASRIFDAPNCARPPRKWISDTAPRLAAGAGTTIEPMAKAHIPEENIVTRGLTERGDRPGLVPIISAMEACNAHQPFKSRTRTGRRVFLCQLKQAVSNRRFL